MMVALVGLIPYRSCSLRSCGASTTWMLARRIECSVASCTAVVWSWSRAGALGWREVTPLFERTRTRWGLERKVFISVVCVEKGRGGVIDHPCAVFVLRSGEEPRAGPGHGQSAVGRPQRVPKRQQHSLPATNRDPVVER
ncbi:hypothetical protein BJV77DRAFT_463098 [Russula vinacea]|nr:hypothetical protein BJV77DRAFT_463098 [Russula vinacea]